MGNLLSTPPPNPSDRATTTMDSSPNQLPQNQQNPESLKTLEDPQNPVVQQEEEAASDPPPMDYSSKSTEKDQDSSTVNEEEGGEEEEEEGECGFCLFMKGGGCRDSFTSWEKCIEEAEKNGEDIVDKCADITGALKKCMEAHSDYYAPILMAEKAAEEEAIRELEKEKEKESASGSEEAVRELEKEKEKESASGSEEAVRELEKEKDKQSASGSEEAKIEAS
ncbi:hypothetical protein RHGRI_034550 [Rhododendron griersonianum]|uniref:GCK domain-containing protein n=1 Tax=Rhododendron griersonianum TaxID=479676 RepID=A0AAV6I130_9ERIC|nr:hypothetical protein RHGRI_034550 [Rhododendron griersonianum]